MADVTLAAVSGSADTAVIESPEIQEIDTGTADDGVSGGEDSTDTDGLEPVVGDELNEGDDEPVVPVKNDGRTLPADLKASLAELKKTNPKMADQISKDYFKVRQFEQLGFKSPADVKAMKDTIDGLTGLNGETGLAAIESLQADAQEFNDEISAFTQGDPALLQKLATSSPEGFAKLIPHAIKLFRDKSPQEFAKLEEGIIDSAFTQNNVYPHVDLMVKAIVEGNQAEAARLAKALQGYLNGKQGKGNQPVDKDREAFQTERQQWETQKASEAQQKFEKEMYAGLNTVVTDKVKSILTSLLPKGFKLPVETESLMLKTIFGQIDGKLQEKQDYLSRAGAIFKTKDLKRVHNFMVSRIDPLLLPLTKSVFTQFRGVAPGKKAAPGVKSGVTPGNVSKGMQARKPTLQEAQDLGFSKEEYLNALGKKKLERAGKTLFTW